MSGSSKMSPPEPAAPYPPAASYPSAAPYSSAADDRGEDLVPTLRSLFLMARRRIRMILLTAAIGTGLAALFAYVREPVYTAQALVMLAPTEDRIVDLRSVTAGMTNDTSTIETQIKLLTSPVYLAQLADRLQEAERDNALGGDGLAEGLAKLFGIVTGLADEGGAFADLERQRSLERERQVARLARALRVRQEGRSLVLSINFTSKSPNQAAQLANALADFYIEHQLSDKLNATKRATRWLEVRLAELKQELENSEQAVERYRSEHQLPGGKGVQIDAQQIADLTNMLVATRAELSEKETRLRYIRDLQARGGQLGSVTEVLQSPYLISLWQQESALQQQEADLRSSFGPKHPRVRNLLAEQQNVATKIGQEIERLVDNISNEISVLAAKEKSIEADIRTLIDKTDAAGQAEVELRQLERQAEANRRLYEEFLQRYKETREQQDIVQPNAKIIAHAEVPTIPSSIPPGIIMLAGFLSSSMVGLGLAWMLERLDKGVRSGKEIEGEFGLPCLGLIPFLPSVGQGDGRRPHQYLLAKPLSVYAETIRLVHTTLRLSNKHRPPRVIQVTSSIPGEGKTVFAVSLATAIAQEGHRTLLLDLDLRHPSVRREIAIPGKATLANYVAGEVAADALVHQDAESGLDVIALPSPAHNPTMVLTSEKLRDLVQTARERYDYVIIDSTPVLGVSDSRITGEIADAILLVVQWGETPLDTVRDTLAELTENNITVNGAVLTQVHINRHARYGYGGIDQHYKKYRHYYRN